MPKPHLREKQAQGEGLNMVIGEAEGFVVLDFGKPTQWLALEPSDMIDLAKKLTDVSEAMLHKAEAQTNGEQPS